ncbi:alpha/beta hydrolase [Halocatena salina]|uniref:Dienelactone hydrolase family protein n=1 Tax=Halocatena salina TaxID=2934340 RepID=A0A8U0A2Z2_9EURY|nr:CocE/NonD family hydrolase [Halocatena salina]UPM42788.1 dienelactone hydrolase family protein [Halocatena salina]
MTDHNGTEAEDSSTNSEPVVLEGARDVRGTVTAPEEPTCVVACPPHPQMGGTRTDRRLTAVTDALAATGIASLRFDYGEWDEGRGEYTDTLNAIAWASERYERVGVYGFSFGGTLALVAAGSADVDVACICALAPDARIGELDAVAALGTVGCPTQIIYGKRDTTAEWEPIVERVNETGHTALEMSADHFFVGQTDSIAERVTTFFQNEL